MRPFRNSLAFALCLVSQPLAAQRGGGGPAGVQSTQPAQQPRFTYVGPAPAGRISAIAGVPGDTTTYYVGAASGGIWKTTDGARTFTPIFDDQPVQAIGALAVAPSNPRIVWAGTGEAWAIRDADVMGDGVYKSTDAGATWTERGTHGDGTHRQDRHSSDESEHRLRLRARAARRDRSRSAACIARRTAARRGSACCSSTRTPAARALDRPERSQGALRGHVGSRDAHVGDVLRRQRAAACTSRATAARRGSTSRIPVFRIRRSARSTWRSRRRTRSACTR